MHTVGRKKTLQLDTSKLLGKGSLGYVFKGKFFSYLYEKNIDVAIKRMQKADHETDRIEKIEREREMLKTLDHPKIIRYRFSDFDKDFFYIIALDLCDGTLLDLLNKNNKDVTIPPKYVDQAEKVSFKIKLLEDIADGLNYLHDGSIIHGDLTPQNVLLKKITESQDSYEMKAMISDFGLSLKLEEDLTSITASASHAGTRGWKAKELLVRGKKELRTSADVFAFGCLVQFTLSLSRNEQHVHPFGDLIVREVNILSDNRCFYLYGRHLNASSPTYDYLLGDILIDLCINSRALERLTTSEILENPLFWDSEKKLLFVSEIFNKFNARNRYVDAPEIEALEAMWNQLNFDRDDYIPRLVPEVCDAYNRKPIGGRENTLFFFMRLMRNVKQHFHDYEDNLGDLLGDGCSDNFVRYFFGNVPPVFPVIYITFYNWEWLDDYFHMEAEHVDTKRNIAWSTVLYHFGFEN